MDQCSRFSYLLEPIRDLTKNWEVDVAGQLDDYLSEVSSSTPAQWFINNINVYTYMYIGNHTVIDVSYARGSRLLHVQ